MANAHKFNSARSAGEAFLGVEVSWDMGEITTDLAIPRDYCEALFSEAGADPDMFKPRPTPESSLSLASRIGWSHQLAIDPRTISVKQLSKTEQDSPLAFGVFYRISVEGERDRWELGARVRVNPNSGDVVVATPPDEVDFPSETAQKWAEAIAEYANARPHTCFNTDVSKYLIQFGTELGWVTRRASGGVYFLPGELGARYMQVLDGLEALTSDGAVQFEGSAIPQYADPRTLQTWQRRATQSFDSEIASLTGKLKDMTSRDNVRESSFDIRVAECTALIRRAEQYSTILEEQLGPLKQSLDTLRTQFGDAQQKLRESKGKADRAFESIQAMAEKATTAAASKKPTRGQPAPQCKARPNKSQLDRLFNIS